MTLSLADLRSLASYRQQHGTAEGFVPTQPKKKRKNEEMAMQMAVVAWWSEACIGLGVPEILLWHTPNGTVYAGTKEDRARIGAMMKRSGVRDGVPDLFVAVPRLQLLSKGASGLFVEMKTPTGVLSKAQKIMLPELERQGFRVAVCRTVEDAQQVIRDYLST